MIMADPIVAQPGAAAIDPKDLDLIPQAMVDDGKDDADIWNEIVAAEDAAKAGKDAPEKPAVELVAPEAPEGTQAAPAAPQADIWANATPEQKAAYDALVSDRAKLEQKARSAEGRATAHQRKIDELYRQMQPSANGADASRLQQARRTLTAVESDYPEIINPVAQVLDAVNENINQLSAAEQRRREAAEAELAEIVRDEEAKLAEVHPDWQDVLSKHGGPQFAAWVEDQPSRYRDAFVRNANAIVDSASVAEFIGAYKAHLGIVPATAPAAPPLATQPNPLTDRRARQLAATASPTASARRPVVSGIPEDADDEAAWNAIVADRQRQRA